MVLLILVAAAQPVQDDVEQVLGLAVPSGLFEASQAADEEYDVPGVDVGADGPVGFARVEQRGQCRADRAVSVRGQVMRYRCFDGGEDP